MAANPSRAMSGRLKPTTPKSSLRGGRGRVLGDPHPACKLQEGRMHFSQAPLKVDIRITSLYSLCAVTYLSVLPAVASICRIHGMDVLLKQPRCNLNTGGQRRPFHACGTGVGQTESTQPVLPSSTLHLPTPHRHPGAASH